MEKLILIFVENFRMIAFVIAIVCFVVPNVYSLIRKKKRKIKSDILDKYTIMNSSENVGLSLFHIIVFIIGLFVIYIAINITENNSAMRDGIIFGIIICLYSMIIIFKPIKAATIIKKGEYVIILDELMDKYYYNAHAFSGEIDSSGWQLYFKDFFKKYNKYIYFRYLKEGNEYKIGDKFYLVFMRQRKIPLIFPANEYTLAQSEKDKLKTINEVDNYIKLEKFILKEENNNKKSTINRERIVDDFFDKHQKLTVLFNSLAIFFILLSGILVYKFYFNLGGLLVISLVFVCFLLMSIVKIKYLLTIINNIKKGNYKIEEDVVVSLNSNLQFRNSNEMISFKFENYNKIVYADKKDYLNSKIGDKFYLVFVKGEKEPIKIYNVNSFTLDKIDK